MSDFDTATLSCLTIDGKTLHRYKDDDLKSPRGLFVDDSGNVLVCGACSINTVQVITSAGKKHKTLLSSKDVITQPSCVSLRPNDGTLAVGCAESNVALVYKIA